MVYTRVVAGNCFFILADADADASFFTLTLVNADTNDDFTHLKKR